MLVDKVELGIAAVVFGYWLQQRLEVFKRNQALVTEIIHLGSSQTRAQPPARFLLAVSTASILYLSCATAPQAPRSSLSGGLRPPRLTSPLAPPGVDRDNLGEVLAGFPARFHPQPSWSRQLTGGSSQLNQSCGAACAAPVNASTGELLSPAATRAGQVLEKVVQVAETLQGLNTLERMLSGAELELVEATLKACVAQAHADINELYQQRDGGSKFKNGKFPDDTECKKIVRLDEGGDPVTLAQELGKLKHAAAFACIKARLPPALRENFTVEPRYKPDPEVNGVVLTNKGLDTLHPDFVVHGTRNATDVQCVYEFKFPCLADHKLNPFSSPGVIAQLRGYQKLTRRCPAALVSPKGLESLEE
ncbi:hypothetical protein [Archangium sp.]|uniref:hypothetical protein n=1 Tax=Archangium sp. TaxID=1872627 RepID=UPI002D72B013|nr:hypothetical protein [Archangium sp.]HYO59052.1 hypothetical protein [Archangium sp.]